jgi:hypothetical protein
METESPDPAPFGLKPNGEPYKHKPNENHREACRKYARTHREKCNRSKAEYMARKKAELQYLRDLLNYSLETL